MDILRPTISNRCPSTTTSTHKATRPTAPNTNEYVDYSSPYFRLGSRRASGSCVFRWLVRPKKDWFPGGDLGDVDTSSILPEPPDETARLSLRFSVPRRVIPVRPDAE